MNVLVKESMWDRISFRVQVMDIGKGSGRLEWSISWWAMWCGMLGLVVVIPSGGEFGKYACVGGVT